jgi:hypothetical protein
MSQLERRRHPRLPATDVRAQLRDRIGARPVRLIDLGDTGARVETLVWMTPGTHYLLSIDEPAFQITGRVVHARLLRVERSAGGSRPVFEVGLDFEAARPAARQQLAGLMRRLAALALVHRLPTVRASSC